MVRIKCNNFHVLPAFIFIVIVLFLMCYDFFIKQGMCETGITSNLEPGSVTNIKTLSEVEFTPGVKGRMYWGKESLINFMTMKPGTEIPEETLPGERILIMTKGSIEQLINGEYVHMEAVRNTRNCVYIEKGSKNGVKAGTDGAEFVEIYYPVRLDYTDKAGVKMPGKVDFRNYNAIPNFPPNMVFNYFDIQLTELATNMYSRLINGKGVQVSLISMEPGSEFSNHKTSEEHIMFMLRGSCELIVMDNTQVMNTGDIIYFPSSTDYNSKIGSKGADVLDVFCPVSADYLEKMEENLEAYHAIIPHDAEVELVIDGTIETAINSNDLPGLLFTEGPTWMDGMLYFSSLCFSLDCKGYSLVAMRPDGTYKYIIHNKMRTNGTMAKGNGNLVVCDMFGHRIIEVSPAGDVVDILATHMSDGTRLDGPNDLVIDAEGGIYFTDPQYTPGLEKTQPGKTVNYVKPNGDVIRVIEPGEIAFPNGVLLSPDGNTLYVNNTFHDKDNMSEAENYVCAYDVNEDGTLSNKRRFAKLFLPPEQLEAGTKSTISDGMTIDELGNIYVTSNMGIQIFNSKGKFIGIIHVPVRSVNCCFGGDDYKTLYMTCRNWIYSIKTNVKGLHYPLKK